ncbi:hypothetical protein QEV83_05185 [Methylocapsa sp. D3K7]|uniref:hypothetical protein n=1 Tax=Methylocapsa sp. D3K7 TaxID=3041435 RepID=UPI00244E9A29|nr:hypothetical protein [Methylocapsa sp. D3K7]WGJ15659.1 hypothetical protein QEV83_05185 [Methylocapsa sp. D3K7]
MSISLALAILIPVSLAAVWVASLAVKRDLERLANLDKWSRKYASSARDLLTTTGCLPASIIDDLAFWNGAVADKKFPFLFAIAISVKRQKLLNGERTSAINSDDERIFIQQNPEFEEKYINTSLNAFMTIGYSHWFWGGIIRAAMADIFAEHKRRRIERFSRAVQKEVRLTNPIALNIKCPAPM